MSVRPKHAVRRRPAPSRAAGRRTPPKEARPGWLVWVDGYWRDGVWIAGHYRCSRAPSASIDDG